MTKPDHCSATVSLPVVRAASLAVRPSRMGRRRATVLILIHLLIIGHIAHWVITGSTLSPVEPSEAMYTLDKGHLNAGFILFAAALLGTLIFGRFFCGWGCHILALQDLCAWMLKKARIRPKPFRSRLLLLAPLALALYMFVWPTVYRLVLGLPRPELTNHLVTTKFWQTFPGFWIGLLTFLTCGFAIVYFLGAKGFCTYGCPYGGFFAPLDKFAPGRIRVTDACHHCGHCTTACTSNVRVHEEVALYGMVVDPGCMKCMDCVSVCPNDALYFGFGRPATGAKPISPRKAVAYDASLGEEIAMVLVGLAALLSFRGLYGYIPLLMSMGMAAIIAFVLLKTSHLLRNPNVRLQNLQLKRGGRTTGAGWGFLTVAAALSAFAIHSAAVQALVWDGQRRASAITLSDEIWSSGSQWWEQTGDDQRSAILMTISRLEAANHLGFLDSPAALDSLVPLYLAKNDVVLAESAASLLVERDPDAPETHYRLAGVLRKSQKLAEAETRYRQSLSLDPAFFPARTGLSVMLQSQGRVDDVLTLYRTAPPSSDGRWHISAAMLLASTGRMTEAADELNAAIRSAPENDQAHAYLAMTYAQLGNLAQARAFVERAIELSPNTARHHALLGDILEALGDPAAAQSARQKAQLLMKQ